MPQNLSCSSGNIFAHNSFASVKSNSAMSWCKIFFFFFWGGGEPFFNKVVKFHIFAIISLYYQLFIYLSLHFEITVVKSCCSSIKKDQIEYSNAIKTKKLLLTNKV